MLTDPVTGAMLTVDRRSYVVPADLRAFLTQRDLTCRFPGCRIPAPRCDIDHTTAWEHGGTTDAGNLAALCRRHHTLKHESRWTVEHLDPHTPDGVLAWTSPRGHTYLTTPGSTDHTLDHLDTWATHAQHLVTQALPALPSDGTATTAPAATSTDLARPASEQTPTGDDEPPF